MAQSNLTISVGIDTAKLRADAAIVKAELREVTKEISRAADEARRTGDTTQLRAQTARQQELIQQYRVLTQQIAAASRAQAATTPVVAALDARFAAFSGRLREAGTALTGMADTIFPHFRELAALSLAAAGFAFLKFTGDAAKAVDQLQDSAEALGRSMNDVLAIQLSAARAGADPAVAIQGQERLIRMAGQARLEIAKLSGSLGQGVDVLRGQAQGLGNSVEIARGSVRGLGEAGKAAGDQLSALGGNAQGTVNIVRGGVKPVLDTTNAFTTLNIQLQNYGSTQEENARLTRDVAIAIDGQTDASIKATLAQQIWGRGWAKQIELLKDQDAALKAAQATIQRFSLTVSKAEEDQSKARLASEASFRFVAERIRQITGNILGQALVPLFDGLTDVIGRNSAALRDWAQRVANELIPVARDFVVLIRDGLSGKFETAAITQAAQVLRALAVVVGEVVAAFRGLIFVLDQVAAAFNSVFGTEFSGTGLLVLGLILRITGAFRLLGAGIAVVTGAFGLLRTAMTVGLTGLVAGGALTTILRFLGPAGLIATGILLLIGHLKDLGKTGADAAQQTEDAAKKAADAAATIARGGRGRVQTPEEGEFRSRQLPIIERRQGPGGLEPVTIQAPQVTITDTKDILGIPLGADPNAWKKALGIDPTRTALGGERTELGERGRRAEEPEAAGPPVPGQDRGRERGPVTIQTPTVEITSGTLGPPALIGERGRRVEEPEIAGPPVPGRDRGRERLPEPEPISLQPLIDQITTLGGLIPAAADGWRTLIGALSSVASSITPLTQASNEAARAVSGLASDTAEMAQEAAAAGKIISEAVSTAGEAAKAGESMTFARGGEVRGPGTSTSDSIPARLSAGEYVVNAASVRRVGVELLHRINRYAGGGSVLGEPLLARFRAISSSEPTRTFAQGGRVGDVFNTATSNIGSALVERVQPMLALLQVVPAFAQGGAVSGSSTNFGIVNRIPKLGDVFNTVSNIGVGLMNNLTTFAEGGLVTQPPIRFAERGIATPTAAAAGGRPVHLHLGDQSFPLTGPANVVDALVSHAHSQQLRSAGVKPSWFAARPSGR